VPRIPPRLSIVTVGARDVRALRSFYEGLFGPSPSGEGGDFARFELGGATLALFSTEALAEEAGQPPPGENAFRGFTLAVNVEREELVDEVMEEVRAAGGRILTEPVTREWGGRSGYWADPEGNVWEVAWVPGASFDERGAFVWPR
jgi:catechol 2,3-dioxygenase-like lactoylglutathione lyase family enzyme